MGCLIIHIVKVKIIHVYLTCWQAIMCDVLFLGKSLLVKPITEPGQTSTQVYFPDKNQVQISIEYFLTFFESSCCG